jgi:NAD(P)-dependent dehydrogenase (short-subunit alcohol dehydrogenase family)
MNMPLPPVVLVTGGTAGIGGQVTIELARAGFEVWFVGRSVSRGQAMERRLWDERLAGQFIQADLDSQDQIGALALRIDRLLAGRPLAGLVNNLGGLFPRKVFTPDGVEKTYAYNFVHPLLLACLLLPHLAAGGGRVVQMSTGYHHLVRLTWADLAGHRWDCAMNVYGRAKLLSVQVGELVGLAWASRGVGVHFADPGMADTPLTKSMRSKDFPWYGRFMAPLVHSLQPLIPLRWCASSTLRLFTRKHLHSPSGVYVLPGPLVLAHSLVGYSPTSARAAWPQARQWFTPAWGPVVDRALGQVMDSSST